MACAKLRLVIKVNTEFATYLRAMAKRRALIRAARRRGLTLEAVGQQFGISRERVRQIVQAGK